MILHPNNAGGGTWESNPPATTLAAAQLVLKTRPITRQVVPPAEYVATRVAFSRISHRRQLERQGKVTHIYRSRCVRPVHAAHPRLKGLPLKFILNQ